MDFLRDWLGPEQLDTLKVSAVEWGIRFVLALLLLVVGLWLVRMLSNAIRRAMQRTGQDAVLVDFVRNLAYGALMAVLLVAVLQQMGMPSTSLIAALGAAGLAIGLALKDSLANLAAGVLLITFRPFRAGDFVEVAGQCGSVVSVRLFFTLLATPDNREITIPNNEIATRPIVNYTARDSRRVDMEVGVAYGSDALEALEVIRGVLERDPRVLEQPEPALMVLTLADSSVNLAIRPWVRTPDYWTVRSDLLAAIKQALEDAGIEIPFPQRTVRVIGGGKDEDQAAAAGA
ncbi:MAG TPA: mechanosensitive ion channel family protein [Xanthomonadaceae bacterium]|nr:mechanosensitive ion channel family protein [Xanthomonadaceae bacterium]